MGLSSVVDMRVNVGGKFMEKIKKGRKEVEYQGGIIYLKCQNHVSEINVPFLRDTVCDSYKANNQTPPASFRLWFRQKGKALSYGRAEILDLRSIKEWLQTEDKNGILDLYCVEEERPVVTNPRYHSTTQIFRSKFLEYSSLNPPPIQESQTKPIHPIYKVKLEHKEKQKRTIAAQIPSSSNQPIELEGPVTPKTNSSLSQPRDNFRSGPQTRSSPPSLPKHNNSPLQTSPPSLPLSTQPQPRTTPRVKQVARKHKNLKGKGKEKVQTKSKAKKQLQWDDEDYLEAVGCGSSSELSDVDINWEPGEEEIDEDELFQQTQSGVRSAEILKELEGILDEKRPGKQKSKKAAAEADSAAVIDADLTRNEIRLQQEIEGDSDELRSLASSDDEVDLSPYFNPEVDFKRGLQLEVGLKFNSVDTLRKALQWHAIDNRYEYYFLQNDGDRVTIYCRYRCDCNWDPKRCRIVRCKCKGNYRCHFHLHARQLFNKDCWQIRSWTPEHNCEAMVVNSKVTSEYLCERYLEEWRINSTWRLESFKKRVFLDLGTEISYAKAWLTRARVKLILYGNASEQYMRVWDYAAAVKKWNIGSSAVVEVNGLGGPEPPIFLRMYICLEACKLGFKNGCRPIIGVDGCHLKGAFPGQILVAVGKDGNNNIYPFAWAVVEVENTETWCWFLDLIMRDLGGDQEGEGLTFMSDRQKGLLEAFQKVVPKAEKRFCVRHIWANFKLKFLGTTFKDLFWGAARATTQHDFQVAMESIRFLSEEAYCYLDDIPAENWSRHQFSTVCKSNMLLNNLCETFNAVIRDARDKPILTLMVWLRKYIMKRNYDKWEGVQKYKGRMMPYIDKIFAKHAEESKNCMIRISRRDMYEVSHRGDQCVVDLQRRTCNCYQWDLTGIPCVHAYRSIKEQRGDPKSYVSEVYSRDTYLRAYEHAIGPMSGVNHWDKVDMPHPLPPVVRKMLGRPKLHKRKKEKGEDDTRQLKLKRSKTTVSCSKCGQLGHNCVSCKTQVVQKGPKNKGGRPPSDKPWVKDQRAKKKARVLRKEKEAAVALGALSNVSSSQAGSSNSKKRKKKESGGGKGSKVDGGSKVAYSAPPVAGVREKLPIRSKKKKLCEI